MEGGKLNNVKESQLQQIQGCLVCESPGQADKAGECTLHLLEDNHLPGDPSAGGGGKVARIQ